MRSPVSLCAEQYAALFGQDFTRYG